MIYQKMTANPNSPVISEIQMLDNLDDIAEGHDQLPAQFLQLIAAAYSGVITHLVNQTLGSQQVPHSIQANGAVRSPAIYLLCLYAAPWISSSKTNMHSDLLDPPQPQ